MDKKENYLQKLLGKRAKVQSTDDSLNKKKDLDDILEDLVAAFSPGCFCPPSAEVIAQIKTALDNLALWSTSAPISNSLKLELQDAINTVKAQLEENPFSCCDTIKALQELEVVLSTVVSALPPGQQLHLLGLLQQLQALFAGYIACLACESGPTASYGNFFNNDGFVTVLTDNPFPFNMQGPIAGGIFLLNPTTIFITNGGDYRINFVITHNSVSLSNFPVFPELSLFLNNVQVPNQQTNFGLDIRASEGRGCKPIVGDTILSIPNNSTLQLRNITTFGATTTITTCNSVGNNVQLSLFKLN